MQRVREMMYNERMCCAFLTFELREEPDEVCLTEDAGNKPATG
jgi:hypothetical protein